MKKRKPTPREKKFVHNYFYNRDTIGNALQSAVSAGFTQTTSEAKAPAWVGLSREKASNKLIWDLCEAERKKIEADYDMSEQEILRQYKRLCSFDIRKLYDKDGNPIPIHKLDDDSAAAIAGIEILSKQVGDEDVFLRTGKIKIIEKKSALDSMAKIKGMFKKDNEQQNPPFSEVFKALMEVSPDIAEAVKKKILESNIK